MKLGFVVSSWEEKDSRWVATAQLPGVAADETTAFGSGYGATQQRAIAAALRHLALTLDPAELGRFDV